MRLGVFPNRREFDAVWGAASNIGRDIRDCSRQPPAFDFGLQDHPQIHNAANLTGI
jgi:hypothetical protein